MRSLELKKLLASLAVCFGAAAIGGAVTRPAVTGWYLTVRKPEFTPPNEVFGPVWSLLYLLMAVALYLVWCKREKEVHANQALLLFATQLVLNVCWSVVFFGFHSIAGGLAVIVLLWAAVAETIRRFWRISQAAALCLVPYLAWLSLAATLNYALWRLNP